MSGDAGVDVFRGVVMVLWIVGIHLIEANVLNPKIIGTAAKIHPVLKADLRAVPGRRRPTAWSVRCSRCRCSSAIQVIFMRTSIASAGKNPPAPVATPILITPADATVATVGARGTGCAHHEIVIPRIGDWQHRRFH